MRYSGRFIFTSVLFLSLAPVVGYGDAVDLSTPQAALHAFVMSQAVFDPSKLKACTYHATPESLDAFCKAGLQLRETDQAAATKYAASPKRKPAMPKPIGEVAAQAEKDWKTLTTIPIKITGNSAILPGPHGKGFNFQKFDDQWKVDARAMTSDPLPEADRVRTIAIEIVMPIWAQVTREINSGKFSDWPAAEASAKKRIAGALAESAEFQEAQKTLAEVRHKQLPDAPRPDPAFAPTAQKPPQDSSVGGYDAASNAKRTPMVGGSGGGEFALRNPGKGPVIGFHYKFGNWNNRQVLSVFEPLFDLPADPVPEGRKRDEGTILARKGYAVAGLLVDTDNVNAVAVRITFMRLDNGALDAKQTYTSEWVGVPSRIRQQKLAGTGEKVVGTFGRKGLNMDSLGLLLESDFQKSEILGGPGGGPFGSEVTGAPVVGFSYRLGNWGRSVISSLDPIFADAASGDPAGAETKSLRAREGYVVSALLVDTDDTNVTAVRLTCMRMRDGVLDPSDKYQSDWIGVPSKIHQQKIVAPAGQALVGIFGRRGLNLDALGLLFGTPHSPGK